MNNSQRLYDLGYSTVIGYKQLNPFCYFKSLQLIKERKTQYPSFDKFNLKKVINFLIKTFSLLNPTKNLKIN